MLTRVSLAFGALLLLASGVLASLAQAQAQLPTSDPAAVVTAYEMARNRRDVDGALAFFADDAVVSQRSTTFTGKDEIRRYLDGATARSRFVVISDRRVVGTHITWTERIGTQPQGGQATTQGQGLGQAQSASGFEVTAEAVIQEGKITSLGYSGFGQVVRPDASLEGRAQVPAAFGFGAVALVMFGLLVLASAGPHGMTSASRLRGTLMQDLRGWSAARQDA